ncbi:MAG: HORMA domain containing protein [Dehalococcoidia bacterium]
MSATFVAVNTYAHTVTFLTDKMLRSLQQIVRDSGLSPDKIASDWKLLEAGVSTWLTNRELNTLSLEVFGPPRDELVGRWDFDIIYDDHSNSDGGMWVDSDAIRHAIKKAGVWPVSCSYRILASVADGHAPVAGWGSTQFRSTASSTRFSVGTTIGANGAGAGAAYWRRL